MNPLRNKLFSLFAAVAFSWPLCSQPASRFFDAGEGMLFGTYYYPEQWPAEQWERDIRNMAEMGFDFTHFAEFAWSTMEPEEGVYDFEWLDRALELARRHGLRVVMCTPTPTPPAWLTGKHPDMLIVNEQGTTIQHGTRQHVSWSSDVYMKYVAGIVSELARRYGDHPSVIGWQIDNEPSHYGIYDYSENAQRKFRLWLEGKYGTIDALNRTWGNAFWSQEYNDFGQVRIPNGRELPVKANPHAIIDFKRFSSDEVARFVNFQADILRSPISSSQWITTNTMPNHHPVDPRRMDHTDFHTYTRYPVTGHDMGEGELGFRMGSSWQLAFHNDTYRNYPGGIYGVMELQPGQVNWGVFNPQPLPGAIRLWLYHVYAGGSKFVCNYRFRQPLKGSEQYHYGMMGTDGTTHSPGGKEYIQTIAEMESLEKEHEPDAEMPTEMAARRTAILYSIDNDWELEFQPQTVLWNTREHTLKYYRSLKRFGAPVDIIGEEADFKEYPMLIAPAYQLVDDTLIARWKEYAANGGHLVLTCRTGNKNRELQLWEAPYAQPVRQLAGIDGVFYDHLPPGCYATVEMNENTYRWNSWGDVMTPTPGTEVWAGYSDQFYNGSAAVLHRKCGKGSITFVGVDSADGRLEHDVLKRLFLQNGISLLNLPDGVTVEWRDGLYIGLNYSSCEQELPIEEERKILIGDKRPGPAGVTVWK